jgi:hypothetical protein
MLIKTFDILVILGIPIGNSEVFLEFKSVWNYSSLNIFEVKYRKQIICSKTEEFKIIKYLPIISNRVKKDK